MPLRNKGEQVSTVVTESCAGSRQTKGPCQKHGPFYNANFLDCRIRSEDFSDRIGRDDLLNNVIKGRINHVVGKVEPHFLVKVVDTKPDRYGSSSYSSF